MKLDRNLTGNAGRGKYALLKLRVFDDLTEPAVERAEAAFDELLKLGILDFGMTPETEFFVMRIKDKYAASGLYGYANAAHIDDPEYAEEIEEMAMRAGPTSPFCKKPD